MKRSVFTAAAAALAIVIATAGVAGPASAAPPTAPWSGSAGGDVASVTADAAGLNVAGLGVAISSAEVDSQATPRAVSSSSNISAAVAGLPIGVSTNSVSAPPSAGPQTGGIAASVTGLIDVGAITTTNEAQWDLDTACVTSGVLSSATTQTAGLGVLPALNGGVLSLGVSETTGTTSLVQNSGLNYGVQSVASGTISGLSILGGLVTVGVAGETTLTATASGTSTGTVDYAPATVTVTALGSTVTLTPAAPTRTVNLVGVGTVTVGLNTPTISTTATSATASVALLTVDVSLLLGVADVSVDVLPLNATATAPAGGIDCPPPAPVITSPTEGATTDATPTIQGTALAGATVEVFMDGASIGTTTASAGGTWELPVTTPLAEGAHSVTAVQTVNGTPSVPSAAVNFTVDATAPDAPVIEAPADGSSVNTATPPISGTAEANSTVTVTIDGAVAGTTTASPTGEWTFTPTTPLTDGPHTAVATATDAAGNVSPDSNTVTFTVDTAVPAAPVIQAPLDGAVLDTAAPAISGTAEPNSTVTVIIDGAPAGTTTASPTGEWTFTPSAPLDEGAHTVVATATDAAGNVSPESNLVNFTVDTEAPAAPVIEAPLDGAVLDTATPDISGTAEANSTVTVFIDGTEAGATTASPTGEWTFTPTTPLNDGAHTAVATATDALGHVSVESNEVGFTIDTAAPAAPVIEEPTTGDVVGTATPVISGTAEANAVVTVIIDDVEAGTTTASPTGEWSFTPTTPLADGAHSVVATATDAAGNVSPESNEVVFTVDTEAPDAPVIEVPADGAVVDTATPPISGTAEANSTVTVTIDGVDAGTTTASPTGEWTFTPTTPLADGPHTVVATATDAAGNESPESNLVNFTVDTAAPAAPVIESPTDGDVVGTATPPISGTAEANSTVTVTIDGVDAGTTTASPTGEWTFTPTTPLDDGDHTVVATATDAAGNESPESNEVTFTVDTAAPAAPVIDAPTDGDVVDTATPDISGTAEADSTVTVTIDGVDVGTTTASPTGEWTFTPTTPLADGPHTVVATATDAAGNESPESNLVNFTVDTAAPAAPVIEAPADGDVVDTATPPISGTAEANATVTVTIDGTDAGTTTASPTGEWTFTPTTPLADGAHTVIATATDAAGNESPDSNLVNFIVDTVAPPAPVIEAPADGDVVDTATPTISGTAEPNSTVTVTIDGVVAGTTTASPTGEWSLVPSALTEGDHTVVATATDAAGNESADSNEVTFTVDTEAPNAPVIEVPTDGAVVDTATPPISGTAEADSVVTVTIDGVDVGTTTASDTGAWTFTPTTALAEGPHTVVATGTDAAGNESPDSNTVNFTVDTAAPAAPVIEAPADGDIVATATPAITGTAEANSTVTVTIDGAVAGTTTASPTGEWTFTPGTPLAEGPHTATATATDAAGNVSPVSNLVNFTVDTSAPAAPVIVSPADGDVVDTVTPPISGTAEANSTVTVTIDGAVAGTTAASPTGEWTFTPGTPLADGPHTATATATDAAGNVSPVSNLVNFTVDTVAPAAPVIESPADGDVVGTATPPISGTAEANSTVTVTIDGAVAGTTTASPTGEWTFTPTTPLDEGDHTVVATATDAAGNESPESNLVNFTVDTVAPAAPVIEAPTDGAVVEDATPDISGTAEPNATVTVIIDGTEAGTTTASPTGDWTFTPTTPLDDGDHTVVATATDAAGNESPESNEVTFTVDTTLIGAPLAPVITEPSTGDVVASPTPPISGTAEANSTVTVIIDGTTAGTTTASPTGEWTFTPTSPLADGDHTVVATATDAAGNVSPESDEVAFTVDATAPAAPEIVTPTDGEVLSNATPLITGTAEPNALVTVIIDGAVAGTTTASPTGDWSFTPATPLADGEHTVTATATDAAGNVSPEADEVAFTVDTVAPAAPVITSPAAGSTTNDDTPPITGTAEPGSTVTVIIDGVPVGTTTADVNGDWTFTPATPLEDGEHTVSATATDAAGNLGPASEPVTFAVDTTPPAAPVITSPTDGSSTTDTTPTVTGTAEPGSTVTVIIDGVIVGGTTADENGDWTFTPTSPLTPGAHTITATATDTAGNVGPASAPVTVTVTAVTSTPPTTPGTPGTPGAPAGGLATTGLNTPWAALVLASLLIAAGAVTLLRRRVS
ncbi:hypothetical protein JNB62_15275 [Microbacterium jejuense]|uniref:Bacterial Ig-like domain-containing protein n=1 Tax=Microbacterium jejuense TaxID=1263637 RepID=A0ABS7HSN9_9MICO|nr:Ig-like domain-containing protein [Microbacterium jejuense]MBW9095049.1 hypothetical protein [Microbacterium jejuense]